MKESIAAEDPPTPSIPTWRKVTALLTLGSITLVVGILIALVASVVGIVLLFNLEG